MGNHDIGRAFAVAFEVLGDDLIASMTKEQLLVKLDLVGNQFRGGDADFDCLYPGHDHPLYKALRKIFGDGLVEYRSDFTREEEDAYDEEWEAKVDDPFMKRYDFY